MSPDMRRSSSCSPLLALDRRHLDREPVMSDHRVGIRAVEVVRRAQLRGVERRLWHPERTLLHTALGDHPPHGAQGLRLHD